MKILKGLFWFLALLPLTTLAQDKQGSLMSVLEITVKHGHESQFLAGVKLWKECYLKNKGTEHWSLWRRVQGKGIVYELIGRMANWAEMDKKDPASNACRNIRDNFISPNIENTELTLARDMPEFSEPAQTGTKLMWVTFFKVKNTTDFMDVLKNVSSALKTSEGKLRGYWSQVAGGGPDDPDYFVANPYGSFADLDKQEDNPFKVYEKVNGKKAADALTVKANNAIVEIWSYLYTLSEDLSN